MVGHSPGIIHLNGPSSPVLSRLSWLWGTLLCPQGRPSPPAESVLVATLFFPGVSSSPRLWPLHEHEKWTQESLLHFQKWSTAREATRWIWVALDSKLAQDFTLFFPSFYCAGVRGWPPRSPDGALAEGPPVTGSSPKPRAWMPGCLMDPESHTASNGSRLKRPCPVISRPPTLPFL